MSADHGLAQECIFLVTATREQRSYRDVSKSRAKFLFFLPI